MFPLIWLIRYRWCEISFRHRCCNWSSFSNNSWYSLFTSCYLNNKKKLFFFLYFNWNLSQINYFNKQTSKFLNSFVNSFHSVCIGSKFMLLTEYSMPVYFLKFIFFFQFSIKEKLLLLTYYRFAFDWVVHANNFT